MTGFILFGAFVVMLLGAVPIGVALGLAGTLAIWLAGQSIMAVPTNVYAGIAKYPLIAIPMFVLVGSVFDRTGVALRLVRFATALVGAGRGALATVSVLVAMVIGGISGSGPATSAAVGQVVTRSMIRDGYPRAFIASTVGAAAATDILIPPSIAFIIYAVMVPGVSVPAIFAAGMFPGILAGIAIIVPILIISWIKNFGGQMRETEDRLTVWGTFKEAIWGLMAPVVILGGMRIGWIYAPSHVIDVLERMRGPFNVNAAAIEAGVAAIQDRGHVERTVAHNTHWAEWLVTEFEALGLRVTPSVGNFLLVHFPEDGKHSAAAADDYLLARGYILRRVSGYGFPNALRMTVGTEEANRGVIAALTEFLRS